MFKKLKTMFHSFSASAVVGLMTSQEAMAGGGGGGGNNFSKLSENIVDSIEKVPGLISGLAYLVGLLLVVLGILKLKDHVENPTQTPLKDGAMRVVTGGALFATPFLLDVVKTTADSGADGAVVESPDINAVTGGGLF